MTPTSKDLELLRSHNKRIRIRVRLLDSDTYQEVENITGYVLNSTFNKSNDSDIRSTCSLTLYVPNKDNLYVDFDKIWNKRMVELYCGLYDQSTSTYREYSLGRMLMGSGNTSYSGDTQEINLNLIDLMASMTQERGSQIGTDVYIPSTVEGVNVRSVIIDIVSEFSDFNHYSVCEFDSDLPHDLTFQIGAYPIDMLNEILSLFPYYEMFYDEAGVFTVRKIPTKVTDPVDIDETVIDDMLISVSKTSNFSEIRNTTEIWGKDIVCDYAAVSCETVNSVYQVTISEFFTALVVGESYAVVPDQASIANQKMNIQGLGEYFIYTANGDGTYTKISAGDMKANVPYSIRYATEKYVLEGELQVRCIVQEIVEQPSSAAMISYMTENGCDNVQWVINPDSTYGCRLEPTTGKIIGEMKQVLSGEEYSDIYTLTLAYERARYENWKKCRLQDTMEIEMVLIPWMDVNQKIQFTSPISNQVETWIVQSINCNFETWTMNVTVSKFYPYYPWE